MSTDAFSATQPAAVQVVRVVGWTLTAVAVAAMLTFAGGRTGGAALVHEHVPTGWDLLDYEAREVERYTAMPAMAQAPELLVRGTIDSVSPGRVIGPYAEDLVYYANARILVEETLRDEVTLELMLPYESAVAQVEADLVGDRGLFFLRNKGAEAARLGQPAAAQAEESAYYRAVSSQGVILDVGGVADLPLWEDAEFPGPLRGRPFAEVERMARGTGRP